MRATLERNVHNETGNNPLGYVITRQNIVKLASKRLNEKSWKFIEWNGLLYLSLIDIGWEAEPVH